MSFKRSFLAKRKMEKSPNAAPSPAIIPISKGDKVFVNKIRISILVPTVKVEIKSVPAIKAPMYPKVPRLRRKEFRASTRERIIERIIPKPKRAKCLYLQDFHQCTF